MKKLLLATLLTSASFSASADMLVGGDVEINNWQQTHTFAGDASGEDESLTFEASIEHFIPLLPNLKYGQSSVNGDDLEYTKRDVTLYYELLDNDLVSVDAGIGVSNLKDGEVKGVSLQDFEGNVPHLYAAAEVGIPSTPLFLFAKGYGITYEDNDMLDVSAGVQYAIPLVAFDLELQAGYRVQRFDLVGFDDLTVDIDAQTDGFFAGVNVDF